MNEVNERIAQLEESLRQAHAHIINLQDAYNDCRNWFSNVEHEPKTEELDELISLDDCDEGDAVRLKEETEAIAMESFRYWFTLVNNTYNLKSLDDYNNFKEKNLVEFKPGFENV
jgi:hypothetical protein